MDARKRIWLVDSEVCLLALHPELVLFCLAADNFRAGICCIPSFTHCCRASSRERGQIQSMTTSCRGATMGRKLQMCAMQSDS